MNHDSPQPHLHHVRRHSPAGHASIWDSTGLFKLGEASAGDLSVVGEAAGDLSIAGDLRSDGEENIMSEYVGHEPLSMLGHLAEGQCAAMRCASDRDWYH